MNPKIFRRIIEVEKNSAIQGDHFGGHAGGVRSFSHVEIMEDDVLESKLGMRGSTDEPEEEDEDDEEDDAGKHDEKDHVNLGFAGARELGLLFDDVIGSPTFGGFVGAACIVGLREDFSRARSAPRCRISEQGLGRITGSRGGKGRMKGGTDGAQNGGGLEGKLRITIVGITRGALHEVEGSRTR